MTIRHGALGQEPAWGGGAGGAGGRGECAWLGPVSWCNWGWVSYGRLSATGPGQPEAPAHPHQLELATIIPKEAFRRISLEASMHAHSVMENGVYPYGSVREVMQNPSGGISL